MEVSDREGVAIGFDVMTQIQLAGDGQGRSYRLGQNYPSPFNPKTWIPYELGGSEEVRLGIYDGRGYLVRVLELGLQTGGMYTGRNRAAYWDGRNEKEKKVSSGVYFYQLQADEFVAKKKMVILK